MALSAAILQVAFVLARGTRSLSLTVLERVTKDAKYFMGESQIRVMHIISGDLWAGAEVQACTLLGHLQQRCELMVVLMNPGRLANEIASLDIPIVILDESNLNAFAILRRLREEMLRFRPEIIHTHRQKENILGTFANLLSVKAKSVRTVHGAPEFAAKGVRRLQVLADTLVGRYYQQAIISVSGGLRTQLCARFPAHKLHVIYNGVHIPGLRAKVKACDRLMIQPNCVHVGIIGRLQPVKRVDIFLAMAASVVKDHPDRAFRFHVIGDGTLRRVLEEEAHALGISEFVFFHGQRNDVLAWISSLQAIVMCSDHEGTPMVALEALALGTPVIGHKVGGLAEVLTDYPHLLVEDHSPEGYARCLLNAVSKTDASVELSDVYSSEQNALTTMALYANVLTSGRNFIKE